MTGVTEPKRPWDPLTEMMRDALQREIAGSSRYVQPGRFYRVRLAYVRTRFRLTHRFVEVLFGAVTVSLAIAGLAAFAFSWPWAAPAGQPSYSDVTATAASATVFSSLVFSALAIPHANASAIAPGYSAEVMTRKAPWVTGLGLVLLSAALFGLSTLSPDAAAAAGAGMLTASGFSATWLVSRLLMASADALALSERQARFIRRSLRRAIEYNRATTSAFLGRKSRTKANVDALAAQQSLAYLAGFLRHLRTGITASINSGRPELVGSYWNQMIEMFVEFAVENGGRVGNNMGPISVVLETLELLVSEGNERGGEYDRVAQFCVQQLPRLAAVDVDHPDYAATRSSILRTLNNSTATVWANNQSVVPVSLAQAESQCIRNLISVAAFSDAKRYLEQLGKHAATAYYQERRHIALYATEGLVNLLPQIISTPDHAYTELIDALLEALDRFIPARLLQPLSFQDASELVLPGIGLGNRGLQETIQDITLDEKNLARLASSLIPWLKHVITGFAEHEPEHVHQDPLQDVLSVLLWLALLLASTNQAPEGWPSALCEAATGWASEPGSKKVADRLTNPDSAELLWSILLVCGFGANNRSLVRTHAGRLLDGVGSFDQLRHAGSYTVSFLTGLVLAARDESEEFLAQERGKLPRGRFGLGYDGIHIEGLGRVPSVNRNQTAHIPATVTSANEWAARTFPSFVGPAAGPCAPTT